MRYIMFYAYRTLNIKETFSFFKSLVLFGSINVKLQFTASAIFLFQLIHQLHNNIGSLCVFKLVLPYQQAKPRLMGTMKSQLLDTARRSHLIISPASSSEQQLFDLSHI